MKDEYSICETMTEEDRGQCMPVVCIWSCIQCVCLWKIAILFQFLTSPRWNNAPVYLFQCSACFRANFTRD